MKQLFGYLATIFIAVFFLLPDVSLASEISIRPFLIDQTLQPRDVVAENIYIKSTYTHRNAMIYATVNEITLDSEGEIREFVSPVMTDRTNTITSWIEVSRSRILVAPGGTAEIPLTIRVHPYAEPGEYHVFIGFVEAANRPEAERVAMAGDADGVIVKVTIADQREDNMHISSFSVDRFVTGEDKREITVEVENTGDLPSAPAGEIIFYDSRGMELASVPVNESKTEVKPGEKSILTAHIPELEDKIGRFKANITLKYGANQTANLQDTAFFYLMPIHLLLAIFAAVLFVVLATVLLMRRSFATEEDPDGCDEVSMYVSENFDHNEYDHDIDLKSK